MSEVIEVVLFKVKHQILLCDNNINNEIMDI
jgi:hypothetical protein